MEYMHTRKRTESSPSINHKRTHSTTPTTPSDQKPRKLKSIRYQGPHYLRRLAAKNSYAQKFKLGVTDESKRLCQALLDGTQLVPKESLFDDDIFDRTCDKLEGKNEARVIQDISRLIVPSAEQLSRRAQHLECLTESVNEGWNNSIPLVGPRPQPDYSVGFGREAFSKDQLAKMSPFIGDLINGQSLFLATFDMHFPFLTCESKCGEGELEIADRQNTHSMTLAARSVVELFRMVKRECELHRQILAFSISHDHRSLRIYGHYPVMDGKDTKYYRYPIRQFDFTEQGGRDKWTVYRFTKNVCDMWMPQHFERICSAVDQLPSELEFSVPPLSQATGLSQGLGSCDLSQPGSDHVSMPVDQDSQ
ncbi:hypothetical protein EDB81DRAFT_705993 [Dactylonectria macrodidyma]|uniref:DUF7924 domain-containing protein n=1 Tax=Dactylonectria macrodidyma TaxID=307937 RepID=A0A9P9FTR9_9HYPO|nr:hypothetical protein EDB81DRAFT_705993 [Dactylonectria macrodidyma]